MRVIFTTRSVYPFHGYGGMEKYFYNLANFLVKKGINVKIITSRNNTGKENVRYNSVKYKFISPNFNEKFFIHFWYKLFNSNVDKHLLKSDFDVLHGCGGTYPYVLRINRRPVIFQPFGMEEFKSTKLKKMYVFALSYPVSKQQFKYSDSVASLGEPNTQDIQRIFKVSREKIFNLPNGVNLDLIKKYFEGNLKLTEKKFGLKSLDLTLISVNRLAPNKGTYHLVEALNKLNKKIETKLILVGTGPEEGKIQNRLRMLGLQDKVLHFKNISDEEMYQLYDLADISVTPTLFEGGCPPFVVLEAMAAGKPIVGSNIPFVREGVEDGKNGFLASPANPNAIADAILKMYDKNLIKKMGKRSRKMVKKYDWDKIADKAIKKYEELV